MAATMNKGRALAVPTQLLDAAAAHWARDGAGPSWMAELRRGALARLRETGIPTRRHEDWKYTDMRAVAQTPFGVADPASGGASSLVELDATTAVGARIVFVDGVLDRSRSDLAGLPAGMTAAPLSEAGATAQALLAGPLNADTPRAFPLLATAFLGHGVVLRVAAGAVVETPVELVFVATQHDEPRASHPRVVIEVGELAQATVIERYMGVPEVTYLTNAVVDVALAAGAQLDHVKVQLEGSQALHVESLGVQQERDSRFRSHQLALGGAVARTELVARLDGSGADCTLRGLYLGKGKQVLDQHTTLEHAEPHATSNQLYKGILDGASRGIFTGRVIVRRRAQKTAAEQANKSLLLSDDAIANTRPQLEIYADDVKCAHGATIGRLDDEQLFYLQARGIGKREARALLGFAFANDIVAGVSIEPLRVSLEALVRDWFVGAGKAA